MFIAQNISAVRSRIAAAAARTGRDPASIKLIAVSKTRPVGDVLEAVKAGQLVFGENYAQELRDKAKEISNIVLNSPSPCGRELEGGVTATLSPPSPPPQDRRAGIKGEGDKVEPCYHVEWHFVGHLQKNKIKYVAPVASWIHTIDSVELLEEIVKKTNPPSPPFPKGGNSILPPLEKGENSILPPLEKGGRGGFSQINCLIEVNIAGEANKSGISPENIFDLVSAFSADAIRNTHCALRGLMCMPPFSDDPETSRPYFKKLKNLLDEINSRNIYPEKLTELSMGMSQDYEVAIEEGATMLRVGTAIFGGRSA